MEERDLEEITQNFEREGWEVCETYSHSEVLKNPKFKKHVRELSLIHGPIIVRQSDDKVNLYKMNSYGENEVIPKHENILDRFYSFLREIFLGREY